MGTFKTSEAIPRWIFLSLILNMCLTPWEIATFPVPDWIHKPQENVWLTLAKATDTDTMCLSLDAVSHPFKSCLAGIPLYNQLDWETFTQAAGRPTNTSLTSRTLTRVLFRLPSVDVDPQELDLLGSTPAIACVYFKRSSNESILEYPVSPNSQIYHNNSAWCNDTSPRNISTERFSKPMKLPSGYFLICGDRTWQNIPTYPLGGPCTIGQLSLYNPAKLQLLNNQVSGKHKFTPNYPIDFSNKTTFNSEPNYRNKRSSQEDNLNIHIPPDCDPKFQIWSHAQRFWGSFPFANIGAAKALGTLAHMACWMAKEANATSTAIDGLLADTLQNKKASLQNRAAIDFLLLAHGHGCQEFEGLCCLNFSDHSQSVHKSINTLNQLVNDITINQDKGFSNLFSWLHFPSLSDWINKIIKGVILFLIITVSILIFLPCLIFCVKKSITKSFSQAFLVSQTASKNKEGGDVGSRPAQAYKYWRELKEDCEDCEYIEMS